MKTAIAGNKLLNVQTRILKMAGMQPKNAVPSETELQLAVDIIEKKIKKSKVRISSEEKRVNELLEVVTSLAKLEYDKKAKVSGKGDLLDALASGINMLGEEIESSTISLKEKNVLLKEIHHRVKNNLQVILSLLNLQSSTIQDEELRTKFSETKTRVRSIALVHEKLYQSKDLSKIDFNEYVFDLARFVHSIYLDNDKKIDISYKVDPAFRFMKIDLAIPLGLIINELLTNAFKYAFTGKNHGSINIEFVAVDAGGKALLKVKDDGIGMEIDHTAEASTLGTQLVKMISEQLDGTMEINNKHGLEIKIIIPSIKQHLG